MKTAFLRLVVAAFAALLLRCGALPAADESESSAGRTRDGLLALYDFSEQDGNQVRDLAGVGEPLDLKIETPRTVRQQSGSLEITGKVSIRSSKVPLRLIGAITDSGEITIEAWVTPANTKQEGPARIVTLSKNTSERNFTLGQERDQFDVRFRTIRTNKNGQPSLSSPKNSVTTGLTHIVFTRLADGRTRLYLNGKPRNEGKAEGHLKNWSQDVRFGLGNEMSGDRAWQGTLHLVAIFDRAISAGEVANHFLAGPDAETPTPLQPGDPEFFVSRIAPLLAQNCLECHDRVSRQGGLDLSAKSAAFQGGESGAAIVPGKLNESLVWDYVETDEMPKKRPPLSAADKQSLQDWIAAGAVWAGGRIDPADFEEAGEQRRWVQRLTVPEYIETVRRTFGVDISREARELLPKDLRADGFSNTAYNLNVDLGHIEAYARLAELIVERMDVREFAARFSKTRRLDKTMRKLIAEMGRHVLRGPLTDEEIDRFRGVSSTVAAAGGGFDEAVRYTLIAMLQSPRFLYRIEVQNSAGRPRPVSQYELASRLSYILWGGPPDRELMEDADEGALSKRIEQHAKRMLEDPRAVARSRQFVREWLHLDRLQNLRPNPDRYPQWDSELAEQMEAETLAFFEDLAWKQDRPLGELFNARFTFAEPRLAKHYGLEPNGAGLRRYDLSKIPDRGGLLTQGSLLTIGGDEGSMVARGLFILHDVLRGKVSDPPPCVDTTPVPTKPGLSQRMIAENRIADANCGGCHSKFEPLAFGFEKFDGLGVHHTRDDHGNELRGDGELLIPGAESGASYRSTRELLELLAKSPRVQETLTWKLTQFALGRPLTAADRPLVQSIHQHAAANGASYRDIMTAIVTSDLVRMTHPETK